MTIFRLKSVLKEKKMTIGQLSELTGISRNTISLLIHGKSQGIQFNTLYKIAEQLNVPIGELFEENKNEIYMKAKKYDEIVDIISNK
ncbi:helix-turn-helix transcriptional regulator [Mammaliicoccus sciuri]|uniref:helix-turn-helix domain-containing protein n=1 Tax=Mammaliicoccus sciuri TaxID=1296 RepID=UPI00288508D7|nr:helix-turn-helix transcriptional regulator [Mammaliicoccus sciuri]MDT0701979.1 helix-turn-helix transcriptional regulator [Mammaliicoccus sciuri]